MPLFLSLLLVSMLASAALASPKLPHPVVRRAIINAMRAGSPANFAAALHKHDLQANSVISAQGYTLLHDAVIEGSPEVVEYLLEHDAEVNATNQYGNTPLDEAQALAVDREIVALLEQAGAVHGEGFFLKAAPTAHTRDNIGDTGPVRLGETWQGGEDSEVTDLYDLMVSTDSSGTWARIAARGEL